MPFDNLNQEIHEKLQKLFKSHKGEEITTAEIKRRFAQRFDRPDSSWVQASDHSINMTNRGACWCAGTDKAIFEQIRRGNFRVR